jgi:hypothetical protein
MPKYLQPANRRRERISQRLLAKTLQFPSLLSEGPCFCSHLLKEGAVKNFTKCSAALFLLLLFPIIPLLAKTELMRQSLKEHIPAAVAETWHFPSVFSDIPRFYGKFINPLTRSLFEVRYLTACGLNCPLICGQICPQP